MDKPLPEQSKTTDPASDAGKGQASTASVGAYNPALSAQAFDEARGKNQALKDSPKGRAVIRMFSRGVMGASAFAIGGWWATKRMHGYAPHLDAKNEVQYIAKFFDKAVGTPLKATINLMGHDGEKFVNNFRPTAKFDGYLEKGRSLGHEVVMVTFDFATMSIGDFWGRKIVHTLDPNREKPAWKRDDGSIDWKQGLKTFGKNWWSAVSYSAGEDWAVAVPYCLTMRHLGTPALNKMFPGYKYEFDRNGNGGGMLVSEAGKITGNFTSAGILNLWERFTTYNVGTLMFREAYQWAGGRLKHASEHNEIPSIVEKDPGNPNRTPMQAVVDGAQQFGNWLARSTIKSVTYMIPAVPFFWITRTPQHKFQGAFTHPEKGTLLLENGRPLTAAMKDKAGAKVFFSETGELAVNPLSHGPIDPNAHTFGVVDAVMNPIAKASDAVRTKLRGPLSKIFGKVVGTSAAVSAAETYINASIAYTPYFWAKSDFLADKWDTGRTDAALDRTIAGAALLRPAEFRAGLSEYWRALSSKPFVDPVREQYAKCRDETDATPSDNKFAINPVQGGNCDAILKDAEHPSFVGRVAKKEAPPAWPVKHTEKLGLRERMVHGGKVSDTISPRGMSHAEAEEMRKMLEDFNPPTNSVN